MTATAAVNTVDCGTSVIQGYARIETDCLPGPVCLANAGAMSMNLRLGTAFHSGDNKVPFFCTVRENNTQTSLTLEFAFHATVTSVVIW
ncbi:hypothetical protein [Streptomyces sp. SudanB182_2057]|uniref:hypothetical protein n=1 Tax=Streptomyces sp. SudanB182_2057 TaxID=3035281 RepID=UPI003F554AE1